ncbi:hypothetical protein AB0J72_05520 [Dactylosporangium sp. NPDC049742]|uniref:hypothetical protein n=1 Tax=Dactylosporangium sp. NPDC049742 TaxID=3154737 RepID=UPI0034326633
MRVVIKYQRLMSSRLDLLTDVPPDETITPGHADLHWPFPIHSMGGSSPTAGFGDPLHGVVPRVGNAVEQQKHDEDIDLRQE